MPREEDVTLFHISILKVGHTENIYIYSIGIPNNFFQLVLSQLKGRALDTSRDFAKPSLYPAENYSIAHF